MGGRGGSRSPVTATLYDLDSGEAVGTFVPDADDFVDSLAMSPDGERLAMLMGTGRLIVLDVERIEAGDDQSGAIVVDVVAHTAGSKAIDVSSSGLIATGSSADGLRVWSRDGELLASVPTQQEDPPTFTFAPGTDTLYYEDGGGVVRRFTVDMDDADTTRPLGRHAAASPRRSARGTSPTNHARRSTPEMGAR